MHIGHAALRVPDLERHADLVKSVLGLHESPGPTGELLLSAGPKHHELQLIAAEAAGFDHVGLEVESEEELEAVVARAEAAGAERLVIETEPVGIGAVARLRGPDGIDYEIYSGMERSAFDSRAQLGPLIRRLGHLTFLSDQADRMVDFWLDGLGFRVSDRFEGMTWARCDSDHHGLAVGARPEGTVLHHHAWEVQGWDEIGRYCDKIALEGHLLYWGPVRHGPGFNLATYLPDADGGVIEVYADLLRIVDERAYEPVDWSTQPQALNLWGPQPGEDLLVAGIPVARDPRLAEGD